MDQLFVLILEDNQADAGLIERAVGKLGEVQTVVASGKADFKALLAKKRPDVILSDFRLPQFTGIEACQLARSQYSDIPFILVSGTLGSEKALEMIRSGVSDFVLKDQLDDLPRAIVVALREEETARQKRKAQDQLKASERKFRKLIEQGYDAIVMLDESFNISYASPSVTHVLGYEPEALIGTSGYQLPAEEDYEHVKSILDKASSRPGQHLDVKFRARMRSGATEVMKGTVANYLTDPDIRAFVLNFRNVSPQEQAQQALRKSERFHRALFENAFDAVVVLDEQGRFKYMSPSNESITGYANSELMGTTAFGLLADEDLEYVQGKFQEVLSKHGNSVALSYRVQRKSGECIHCEAYGINLLEDERVQGIVVNYRDITEKVVSEEHRKRLSEIIEAGTDFIGIARLSDHKVLYINPTAKQMIGAPQDWDETKTTIEDYHTPEIMEKLQKEIIPEIEKKGFWTGQSKLRKLDGTIVPISQSLAGHRNEQGELEQLSTIIRDISAQKATEQELREKEAALQERVRENRCLYEVSNLLSRSKAAWSDLVPELISSIEAGFQYQDDTKVRITTEEGVYVSEGFQTSAHQLQADIKTDKLGSVGQLEVFYVGEMADDGSGAFLEEEIDLLQSLAWRIGIYMENQQAWQKVEQQKNFYQTILETSVEGVLIMDQERNVLFRNGAIEKILGYEKGELINDFQLDQVHPEDQQRVYEGFQKVWNGGRQIELNKVRVPGKEGDIRILDLEVYNHLSNAFINGIVINYRDVTNSAMAEEELRKKELQLSEAEKIANVGSFWVDIASEEITFSKQVNRIYEYDEEVVLTPALTNARIHPDDGHKVDQDSIYKELYAAGKYEIEHRLQMEDGRIKYILSEGRLDWGRDGTPSHIVGTIQDITKAREAQNKILEYTRKLDHITSVVPGVIYRYVIRPDQTQYLDFIGKSVKDILGVSKEAIQQDFSLFWSKIHEDDQEAIFASILESVESLSTWEHVFRMYNVNGAVRWVKGHSVPEPPLEDGSVAFNGIVMDITATVEAEQKIKESEHKLRQITSAIPGVVYRTRATADGAIHFEFVSHAIENTIGISPEEAEKDYKKVLNTILEEDREEFTYKLTAAIANDTPLKHEFRIKNHRGEIRWIRQSSLPEKTVDGVRYANGILIDITKEKQAQQYTIDSERSFRDLFDNSIDLIYIQDLDGVFIDVNKRVEEMYGYTKEEIIGKTPAFLGVRGWNDLNDIMRQLNEARKGYPQQFHWWALRKDGSIFPKEVVVRKGTYFGKDVLIANGRDISDWVEAERQIKRNELYFRQLFENSPMPTVLVLPDGKVKSANRQWHERFEYKNVEAVGKPICNLLLPEDKMDEREVIEKHMERKESFSMETIRLTKSKKRIPVLLYGVPVKEHDELLGYYFKFFDLTDKKQAEDEMKDLNAKLLKHNEELEQFAYVTSHNLRAPVANLLGLLDLVEADKMDEHNRTLIQKFCKTANQLDTTLGEMLEIVTSNSLENFFNEQVNLPGILQEIKMELRQELDGANGKVETDLQVEKFTFNNKILKNVVFQLIANAIKFRSPERKLKIRVKSKSDKDLIHLLVKDNGRGIDLSKHNNRLFKMYQRLSYEGEGRGLGLYLVKKQVELAGGAIEVDSTPGAGTEFHLMIPMR